MRRFDRLKRRLPLLATRIRLGSCVSRCPLVGAPLAILVEDLQAGQLIQFLEDIDMDQCTNEWRLEPESSGNVDPQNLYGVRTMHTYEKAPGSSRQSPGYTGFFAIICLFASIFLVWALMRTSLVKTSLEMMSSPPVTTGMAPNAPVNSVAKP